ncbi:MAG: tail fiber protein [Spirochaetota bacterium]
MDPFLGEIKILPLNWAPYNWTLCDGRSMPVNQNQALYSLINNFYGGTPGTNFNLPDLRGRVAASATNAVRVGTAIGTETVTLTATQVPPHTHSVGAVNSAGNTNSSKAAHIAQPVVPNTTTPVNLYTTTVNANKVILNPATVGTAGGGASHTNVQPYLVLGYFICTTGLYPPRS